jgi:hypothetical protein
MENYIGQKCLITTSNWFYAPDGRIYKAVHGTVKSITDIQKEHGLRMQSGSANWIMEIGEMLIAGCQINYIVKCESANTGPAMDFSTGSDAGAEGPVVLFERPSVIYQTT